MALTYRYVGIFKDDLTDKTMYLWDVLNDGVMIDSKRAIPVKNVSPEVWDSRQEAIKASAEAKLINLGFTPEEATLICLNHN
jgi:hypothetical protein